MRDGDWCSSIDLGRSSLRSEVCPDADTTHSFSTVDRFNKEGRILMFLASVLHIDGVGMHTGLNIINHSYDRCSFIEVNAFETLK